MENEVQSNEKSLGFWVAKIVVLFVAVFGIFMMLEIVMPKEWEAKTEMQEQEQIQEEQLPAPKFCTYCGDELPENFEWGRFCPYCGKIVDN